MAKRNRASLQNAVGSVKGAEDGRHLRALEDEVNRLRAENARLREESAVGSDGEPTSDRLRGLVQAQADLKQASARKDAFLAMLGHELRNPLAPIRNGLHLLRAVGPGDPRGERAVTVIERQVEQLVHLVDDLLDATRIARGRVLLTPRLLDLGGLIARTAEDHRSLFDRRGLDFTVELPSGPVPVEGDATRLAQVIGNLLHNAAKFSEPGAAVRLVLSVNDPSREAVVRVSDHGIGIATDLLPHLFEAFSQAQSGLDRRRGGLGLGLSVVKALVELHGGTVQAHSEGVARGAEFTVRLPLAPVENGTTTEGAPRRGVNRRHILVIDDNVDAATTLAELLSVMGHEVVVAHTGHDGLAKARRLGPEVILCDIGLPQMDGYEVARTLRDVPGFSQTLLVALTGYAQPEDRARARAAGFDEHLAKPPSLDRIQALLAAL